MSTRQRTPETTRQASKSPPQKSGTTKDTPSKANIKSSTPSTTLHRRLTQRQQSLTLKKKKTGDQDHSSTNLRKIKTNESRVSFAEDVKLPMTRKRSLKAVDKARLLGLKPQRLSSRTPIGTSPSSKKGKKKMLAGSFKRARKSRDQISRLLKVYSDCNGDPSREQIIMLHDELNLTENQVYKWFWDTKQKNEKNMQHIQNIQNGQQQDEFGGYSKTWLKHQGAQQAQEEKREMENFDGTGKPLTPQQVKFAMKLQKENMGREEEFESIARTLGLDIDREAKNIVNKASPEGRRQVVRRLRPEDAKAFNTIPTIGTSGSQNGSSNANEGSTFNQANKVKTEKEAPTIAQTIARSNHTVFSKQSSPVVRKSPRATPEITKPLNILGASLNKASIGHMVKNEPYFPANFGQRARGLPASENIQCVSPINSKQNMAMSRTPSSNFEKMLSMGTDMQGQRRLTRQGSSHLAKQMQIQDNSPGMPMTTPKKKVIDTPIDILTGRKKRTIPNINEMKSILATGGGQISRGAAGLPGNPSNYAFHQMLAPTALQSDDAFFNMMKTDSLGDNTFVSPSAGRHGAIINNFFHGNTNFVFGAAACQQQLDPPTPLLGSGSSFGTCAKHPNGPSPTPVVLCQHHQQQAAKTTTAFVPQQQ